jgi:acetate CoA/acetoacetate CoA-transferase beta subunit
MEAKNIIARRVAQEIESGMVVNLGVGLPCLVTQFLSAPDLVRLHGENGILGMAEVANDGACDPDLVDPGGNPISAVPGAAIFDSLMSFTMVRGGHLDLTVVGGLEVDEAGRLSNWMIPGERIPGMGGGMDLISGARRVIVAMTHFSKGKSKIVRQCTLPITSVRRVDLVVTELAVIEPTQFGLVVKERGPGISQAEIASATDAKLSFSDDVPEMLIAN